MHPKIRTSVLIILFCLVFTPFILNARADTINIGNFRDNIRIEKWDEDNIINNSDLLVKSRFYFEILKPDSREDILITFNPAIHISSNEAKLDYNSFKVILYKNYCANCFNQTAKKIPISFSMVDGTEDYLINISKKNLQENDYLTLTVAYRIRDYVRNRKTFFVVPLDKDKTVIFVSSCVGNDAEHSPCPKPENILQTVFLPRNIILRGYTENGAELGNTNDGGLVIFWRNSDKNKDKSKVLQYTDLKAEKSFFWISLVLSAFIGAIMGILLEKLFEYISKRYNLKRKFKKLLNYFIKN